MDRPPDGAPLEAWCHRRYFQGQDLLCVREVDTTGDGHCNLLALDTTGDGQIDLIAFADDGRRFGAVPYSSNWSFSMTMYRPNGLCAL